MKTRYRTVTAAAIVITLGVATAGCGRYSISALRAQKAYKDANELYKGSDWKDAAEKYEYVLQQDPSRSEVYFFLANSYDNAYKPSRAGEPENDALIQKAIATKITNGLSVRRGCCPACATRVSTCCCRSSMSSATGTR